MNDRFAPVIEEVEMLIAESSQLMAAGPRFHIVHRFHVPGTNCQAGEEVAVIWLIHQSRAYPLRLPLALRIFFDYLARHRLPQSAAQIEAGIRRDSFASSHGANARTSRKQTRRIGSSSVKEYAKRIRQALGVAFSEAGLHVDPARVLLSESTVGNEVLYRLKAAVEWTHLD